MLGAMVWDSLAANYQLEIIGEEESFKKGLDYDGPKLWYYTHNTVDALTTTGSPGFKHELESKTLGEFGHNIKEFNT